MADLTREQRISRELKRLTKIYKRLPEDQYAVAVPLIENAAFMRVTLADLQEQINAEGFTEEYQNGANQSGVKISAAMQSYNTMIKNYNTVNSRLEALLPPPKTEDKLKDFLNNG